MRRFLVTILLLNVLLPDDGNCHSTDTIFLDNHWRETKYRDLAKFYRLAKYSEEDSSLHVKDYFISNNNLQMVGSYLGTEMSKENRYGVFTYYHENGAIKAEYHFSGGIIDGYRKKYYENGKLKSVEKFDLGVQIDTIYNYHENGNIATVSMLNDEFDGDNYAAKYSREKILAVYDKEGNQLVKDGFGRWDQYFLNGSKRRSINYENGLPHGKWIIYSGHKNKKSCVMEFRKGVFVKGEIKRNRKKETFGTLKRKAFFHSGLRGMDKFIKDNTKGCREEGDKEVIVMITIEKDGKVYFEQVISGAVTPCQLEEIQNCVKNMPDWIPAIQDGKFVESSQAIRFNY